MSGWWAASYVVLWLLVCALTVIVVALARQIGTLHLRLGPRGALEVDDEGPPLGEPLEPAELTAVTGERIQLGGAGEAQLLLFVSPGCPVCDAVLPSTSAVTGRDGIAPYVLVEADSDETAQLVAGDRTAAPVAAAAELARRYGIPGTPYVAIVDRLGVVRSKGTVNNLEQVEGLTRTARRRGELAQAELRAA